MAAPSGPLAFAPWRHRFAAFLVAATLVLIFVGGLVTSTGSGLAVPDWPLSYGMLMPPMVGGVFYEHGHRMAASARRLPDPRPGRLDRPRGERRGRAPAGLGRALAAVIAQGVLGGLTVIFLLPTPISVTHACLAQASSASRSRWPTPPRANGSSAPGAAEDTAGLCAGGRRGHGAWCSSSSSWAR